MDALTCGSRRSSRWRLTALVFTYVPMAAAVPLAWCLAFQRRELEGPRVAGELWIAEALLLGAIVQLGLLPHWRFVSAQMVTLVLCILACALECTLLDGYSGNLVGCVLLCGVMATMFVQVPRIVGAFRHGLPPRDRGRGV